MFEKIKAFFSGPKVKAFLEGPPRRPSPAELLFELANDANRRDAAKAAVEPRCRSCKFFQDRPWMCRRFPEHVRITDNHWCGEFRASDAAIDAKLAELYPPGAATEMAP